MTIYVHLTYSSYFIIQITSHCLVNSCQVKTVFHKAPWVAHLFSVWLSFLYHSHFWWELFYRKVSDRRPSTQLLSASGCVLMTSMVSEIKTPSTNWHCAKQFSNASYVCEANVIHNAHVHACTIHNNHKKIIITWACSLFGVLSNVFLPP